MRRRNVLIVLIAAAAAVTMNACESTGGSLPDPESAGAEIYVSQCARCHGADAGGLRGPNLRTGLAADYVDGVVTDGKGPMPSFTSKLTSDQIETVAQYIASLPRM